MTMMDFIPFTDSTDMIAQPETLRERMRQDGYLYLSRLLPEEATRPLYQSVLSLCREAGWVDTDNRAQDGPRLEGAPD